MLLLLDTCIFNTKSLILSFNTGKGALVPPFFVYIVTAQSVLLVLCVIVDCAHLEIYTFRGT